MRRKPGLIRTAARTAVIAGTATSVAGRVQRRKQQKFGAQASDAQQPPAPTSTTDIVSSLQRLAELKASGALSEQEYAAAKARVLNA